MKKEKKLLCMFLAMITILNIILPSVSLALYENEYSDIKGIRLAGMSVGETRTYLIDGEQIKVNGDLHSALEGSDGDLRNFSGCVWWYRRCL